MIDRRPLRIRRLLDELRRRHVFRVTAAYVVVAFALLQGADVVTPALPLPPWTMTLLVVLALLGLPLTIVLSWVFDLGPRGVETTAPTVAPAHLVAPAPTPALAPTRRHDDGLPRIAVLPFLAAGADADDELFAEGVTEDVTAHLSRIHTLRVISRSSVMRFRERERDVRDIAARLGATTVLDGSVRRVGGRVRIVAQLVDPATDQHLWAETYDRELTDIFEIQSEVALGIATALRSGLSRAETSTIRREPTSSIAAYEHYQKGRHLYRQFNTGAMQRAEWYFRRALELDPDYALAHASLAMAVTDLAETGVVDGIEARRDATAAANTALRIDPELGEGHAALAYVKYVFEFDWDDAEAAFRRAIELRPSDADAHDLYGRMCTALGRFDEAIALFRRAQELDPLVQRNDLSTVLMRAGHYAEATTHAKRALEFDPNDARAHATLGWALLLQGRADAGLAEIENATRLDTSTPQWLAQLAQARAMAGDERGAREILEGLEARSADGFVTPYHLAYIHTGLGEHERALDLLEQAADARGGAIHGIRASFLFAPL
ncbi:MAG TPA: tetratricopeptide repeat protein, partial [Longimicrobiales bacterium]